MSKRTVLIGVAVLALVLLATTFLSRAVGQKSEPGSDQVFGKGEVIAVTFKNQKIQLLTSPRVRTVSGHVLLGGKAVVGQAEIVPWYQWIPFGEVATIEEFSTTSETPDLNLARIQRMINERK